ncbi:MAG: hypothetical protein JNK82_19785 [Myxococcaceae bacterium]|nr:hypothetical protein [Myxococcaceae bacterium]
MTLRLLILSLLLLGGCIWSTNHKPCSPQNCSGCCTAEGACVPGAEASACGSGGAECVTCAGAQNGCRLGTCVACFPICDGRSCGPDGCGGTCGACETGTACGDGGTCVACTPSCDGKTCGDDGCGGTCGACAQGEQCSASGACTNGCGGACAQGEVCAASGQCVPACTPSCAGRQCGSDGCGGTCGTCPTGESCSAAGQCACVPSCAGKVCGSDGCGGSCGTCSTGVCNGAGQCVVSCTPSCTGKTCGSDGCSGSCGACGAGNACSAGGQCQCAPQCVGRQCGSDGCGGSCGACTAGTACDVAYQCVPVCMPESNATFCSRLQRACGAVTENDNCGVPRSVYCGSCMVGQACTAAGQCMSTCTPETDAAFCTRLGAQCGSKSGADNCGTSRTVYCGACMAGLTCTAANQCVSACAPETDAAFCTRLGAQCGSKSGTDNCGAARSVDCGGCSNGLTCATATNTCVNACVPETNPQFCTRLMKTCGTVSAPDNCGTPRTVSSCGTCGAGSACSASNVCVSTRLVFTTSFQALPNTGSTVIEYRCRGTVTTTATGGTRCYRSGGDPVELRINGATWLLYPGCDGLDDTNCMTTLTPSSAVFKDYQVNAGGRLLCDAMGWPLAKTLADKNPGTENAAVAVVQTGPTVVGTHPGLKNYGTYVNCEP